MHISLSIIRLDKLKLEKKRYKYQQYGGVLEEHTNKENEDSLSLSSCEGCLCRRYAWSKYMFCVNYLSISNIN